MKLNKANHKVAVFSIAALALTASAGATINNLVLNRGANNAEYSVFAAEIKSGVTATGAIVKPDGNQNGLFFMPKVTADFTIADPSQFSAGDYIEFSTKNLRVDPWNNLDVTVNSVVVGKIQRISAVDNTKKQQSDGGYAEADWTNLKAEDSGTSQTFRIVFNDSFSKLEKNAKVSIEAFNHQQSVARADRERTVPFEIRFNNQTVAGENITIKSDKRNDINNVYTYVGNMYSNVASDGETITITGMNAWIADHGYDSIKVGDIVEWKIDDGAGIAFNNDALKGEILEACNASAYTGEVNQYGMYYYDKSDCIQVEVVEASPTTMKYKILTTPKNERFDGVIYWQQIKLLDTSSDTIDYTNKKIKAQPFTRTYTRANGDIVQSSTVNVGSEITGAALKAQGEITPRGSVIRRIRTTGGNILEGFESDELIAERERAGTAYYATAPEIPGYKFVGVSQDSAPQNGNVIEGAQIVILLYAIDAQDIEIFEGETPNPQDHIKNFEEKFPGCEVRYKDELDTSKAGTIDATLIISCPDKEDEEVDVKVIVKPAPEDEETPAPQPEAPKTEPKKEEPKIEAPHTGFEKARSVVLATFASLSTFAVLGTAIFKRR